MKEYLKNPGVLIGIFLFLLIPIIGFALFSLSRATPINPPGPFATPTPGFTEGSVPEGNVRLSKTIPGRTTEAEVLNIPGIREVSKSGDQINFEYDSVLILRPNEIITNNELVTLERVVITPEQYFQGIDINFIKDRYGEPEEEIKGSAFYGDYLFTNIYARKGAAFIVNPFTGEIYEAQFFTPMSVEEYKQKYGQDIDPEASNIHLR